MDNDRHRDLDQRVTRAYDALRKSARRRVGGSSDPLMQPTALVHETFLRLAAIDSLQWRGDSHFLAIAHLQMRRVFLDQVQTRQRRRDLDAQRVDRTESTDGDPSSSALLDAALDRLTTRHERVAQVARLRIEQELETDTIATQLGVSPRTVRNDWNYARSWLCRQLGLETLDDRTL